MQAEKSNHDAVAPLPRGSVDTHLHIFDSTVFPYDSSRSYTPGTANYAEMRVMHRSLGIERSVLVQPSVYGIDNRCVLNAVELAGQDNCRAIVVVELNTVMPQHIELLDAAGARGIRLNLAVKHESDLERARETFLKAAAVIKKKGWCIQVHCSESLLAVLADSLTAFSVPVVLDHFAGLRPSLAFLNGAAAHSLKQLLATGRVYVKLSANYRVSETEAPHDDLTQLASWLIAHWPHRLLWGSDWPHTGGANRNPAVIEPFRVFDLRASLEQLRTWCSSEDVFQQILVRNPASLYGFDADVPPPVAN